MIDNYPCVGPPEEESDDAEDPREPQHAENPAKPQDQEQNGQQWIVGYCNMSDYYHIITRFFFWQHGYLRCECFCMEFRTVILGGGIDNPVTSNNLAVMNLEDCNLM